MEHEIEGGGSFQLETLSQEERCVISKTVVGINLLSNNLVSNDIPGVDVDNTDLTENPSISADKP